MFWHKVGLGLVIFGLGLAIFGILAVGDIIDIDSEHSEWEFISLISGFAILIAGNGLINFYRAHVVDKKLISSIEESLKMLKEKE